MKPCSRCGGPMPKPWYSPWFKGMVCIQCDQQLDALVREHMHQVFGTERRTWPDVKAELDKFTAQLAPKQAGSESAQQKKETA